MRFKRSEIFDTDGFAKEIKDEPLRDWRLCRKCGYPFRPKRSGHYLCDDCFGGVDIPEALF